MLFANVNLFVVILLCLIPTKNTISNNVLLGETSDKSACWACFVNTYANAQFARDVVVMVL
jgi:hypothetical protein